MDYRVNDILFDLDPRYAAFVSGGRMTTASFGAGFCTASAAWSVLP